MSLDQFEGIRKNLESTLVMLDYWQKQYATVLKQVELLKLENEKLKANSSLPKNVAKPQTNSKKQIYLFYQERSFTPNQIETLKKNVADKLGLGLLVITKPEERTTNEPLLYAVNFTSRFESTNMNTAQFNTFKRVSSGKNIVLALTYGDSAYSEFPPQNLASGEDVVQLFVDYLSGKFNMKEEATVEGFKTIVSLLQQ